MWPVRISCHNHQPGLTGTACSTPGCTVVILLFQFLWLMLFNSPHTERHLYEKGDGTTMSLIFKAVRLVNALIFMYTTESIITALLHCSNKLLHNFHMNLHFYSHYFWFYSENVSLCLVLAAQGGQGSFWSWQGFSVLLKDTLADWVLTTVGLEPSYTALQPQLWQLIWISNTQCYSEYFYLALFFLDCLKRKRVINDLSPNRKLQHPWQCLRWPATEGK